MKSVNLKTHIFLRSPHLLVRVERVSAEEWGVFLCLARDTSSPPDTMVFLVDFPTAPMFPAGDMTPDLEAVWIGASRRMPSKMRSYNAGMLKKLLFATLQRVRASIALNCCLIQVVVKLPS